MIDYDVPIYDPFGNRGPTYYHPANEAAYHLISIKLIDRDIVTLVKLHNRLTDDYKKRLVLKYAVIEILSQDFHIKSLVNQIINNKTGYSIEENDLKEIQGLYKKYNNMKESHWNTFKTIRDKLSAHRDILCLETISNIWDDIDKRSLGEFHIAAIRLYNFAATLNIYTWHKKEIDENGQEYEAFIQPLDLSGVEFNDTHDV